MINPLLSLTQLDIGPLIGVMLRKTILLSFFCLYCREIPLSNKNSKKGKKKKDSCTFCKFKLFLRNPTCTLKYSFISRKNEGDIYFCIYYMASSEHHLLGGVL